MQYLVPSDLATTPPNCLVAWLLHLHVVQVVTLRVFCLVLLFLVAIIQTLHIGKINQK